MSSTPGFAERLDLCKDFGDVFGIVKKTAERSLGRRRSGLMLYLAELPAEIGAYHAVGSNGIVLNKVALDSVTHSARTIREINAYVYSVLLHEYLHSLGYMDERLVRKLVYDIARENLGDDHPATEIAHKGPTDMFPGIGEPSRKEPSDRVDIVTDFDRSANSYIK